MLFVRVPGCTIKFSPRDCVDFVVAVVLAVKVQLFVALLGTEVRELVRRDTVIKVTHEGFTFNIL